MSYTILLFITFSFEITQSPKIGIISFFFLKKTVPISDRQILIVGVVRLAGGPSNEIRAGEIKKSEIRAGGQQRERVGGYLACRREGDGSLAGGPSFEIRTRQLQTAFSNTKRFQIKKSSTRQLYNSSKCTTFIFGISPSESFLMIQILKFKI